MSNFETLIYDKKDNVAFVTINRPHVLNIYNIQMRDELYQVLGAIRDDPEVVVVIFSGAGDRAFCAGADLSEFLTAPSPNVARQVRYGRDIWTSLLNLPQPTIAALHGYVLGSGIEIAMCCDLRIASDDAQFGLPETGLGIIPGAGGTQILPRAIGLGKALEILLTGRRISAREANNIRLVNRVVPKKRLLTEAEDIARKIVSLNQVTVRVTKQAVVRGLDLPLVEGLEMEKTLVSSLLGNSTRTVAIRSNR